MHDLLVRVGSDLAYTAGMERAKVTLAGQQVQFELASRIFIAEKQGLKDAHHHIDSPQRCGHPEPVATSIGIGKELIGRR